VPVVFTQSRIVSRSSESTTSSDVEPQLLTVVLELTEPLAADVVRASFQDGEFEWGVQVILKKRKILVRQLILERFGRC